MSVRSTNDGHINEAFDRADDVTIPISTAHKSVTYSWNKVNVYARKSRSNAFRSKQNAVEEKHILKDVTGICRPGELLAIMGASGAGKTTLLNVLNARSAKELRIEGDLYVNGEKMDPSKLSLQSAYIQQEDLFIGTCTVKEQLIFQALLKMDKHITRQKRMERVDEVIEELGLNKCRDTLIGIPGRLKGISGGETKRLAFACEVLTDPPLLFCDEPTSGIDSFMAQTIVSAMKTLASEGRGIICTIHQPSSEVFAMFDRVLLMAEGRTAYLGRISEAQQFFHSVGKDLPTKFNPADFFISSLAVRPGFEEEGKAFVAKVCDTFAGSKEGRTVEESVQANMTKKASGNGLFSRFSRSTRRRESPYMANWWQQFSALMKRTFLEVAREPYALRTKLIQAIMVSILIGVIYLDTDDYYDQDKVSNVNGVLFILITQTSFQFAFGVVQTFCSQLPVFLKEHYSGMYSTDTFYIAKNLSELPLTIVLPLLYLVFIYFMVNIDESVESFFSMFVIMILLSNCGLSFGYLVSAIADTLEVAMAIVAPLLIPLMLFGGFFLQADSVPVYLIWLKYISWFNYGYEAMLITQWKDVEYINYTSIIEPRNGPQVIENYGYDIDNWWFDFWLLFALIIFYRTLGYLVLLRKTYTKR